MILIGIGTRIVLFEGCNSVCIDKNYVWFKNKLKDPRQFDHGKELAYEDKARMPNFYLKDEEIEAIVTALLGFNDDNGHLPPSWIYTAITRAKSNLYIANYPTEEENE